MLSSVIQLRQHLCGRCTKGASRFLYRDLSDARHSIRAGGRSGAPAPRASQGGPPRMNIRHLAAFRAVTPAVASSRSAPRLPRIDSRKKRRCCVAFGSPGRLFDPCSAVGRCCATRSLLFPFRIVSRRSSSWLRAVVRSGVLRLRRAQRRSCGGGCARRRLLPRPGRVARMTGAHPLALKDRRSVFTSFPDFPGGPRSSPPMQALDDDSHRRRRTAGVVLNERGEPVLHWPDVIPDGWSVSRRITAMDAAGMLDSAAGVAGGCGAEPRGCFSGAAARHPASQASGRDRHRERLRRLRARGGFAVGETTIRECLNIADMAEKSGSVPWDAGVGDQGILAQAARAAADYLRGFSDSALRMMGAVACGVLERRRCGG